MTYNIEIPHNWIIACYIDVNKQCYDVEFNSPHPGSSYSLTDFMDDGEIEALENYFLGRSLNDIHAEIISLTNDEWWRTHKSFQRWRLAELIYRAITNKGEKNQCKIN